MSPQPRTHNLPKPQGRGGLNANRAGRLAEPPPPPMPSRARALNRRRLRCALGAVDFKRHRDRHFVRRTRPGRSIFLGEVPRESSFSFSVIASARCGLPASGVADDVIAAAVAATIQSGSLGVSRHLSINSGMSLGSIRSARPILTRNPCCCAAVRREPGGTPSSIAAFSIVRSRGTSGSRSVPRSSLIARDTRTWSPVVSVRSASGHSDPFRSGVRTVGFCSVHNLAPGEKTCQRSRPRYRPP